MHNNTNAIRSKEGIDICWVEEARIVAEESWEILIPTIRKEGSEIWITFNAESTDDPVYKRFVINPPHNAIVRKVTWRDNPWFPAVLRQEMEHDRALDPDLFAHIWEGEPRKISTSQIFHGKWIIEEFETPSDAMFYCGGDWGFANDPTAIIRCFIKDNRIYIDREAGGVGVEIDETGLLLDQVLPHKRWPVRGDSSRPETISYLNRQGYNISPSEKGKGSVEDGIQYLRSFNKIVIHPRCRQIIEEMRLYSYKQDKLTGDVLPIPIDAHNHYIDALRYAVEPLMKNKRSVKIRIGAA
jgi:phage terminase large subunit